MKDYMYKYQIDYNKSEFRIGEIDNKFIKESIEFVRLSDEFADKIIYIERYPYNSKIINEYKDWRFRIICNIRLKDILDYIEDWDCCTAHIVLLESDIIQVCIFPNQTIDNKYDMFSIESCAGYGNEMFVEYNADYDIFTPCTGVFNKKVEKAMQ